MWRCERTNADIKIQSEHDTKFLIARLDFTKIYDGDSIYISNNKTNGCAYQVQRRSKRC